MIALDAIFSPVLRVRYKVENTRVGQTTDLDKLLISIDTDGSITPQNGKLRRVVSGLNPEGKSYIAVDDSAEVANIFATPAGRVLGEVAKNEPAQLPMNATGQTRCFVAAIQPHKDQKPTMANRIGFHKGAGISYCLILNGALTYMTDTQETLVRSGDLVVERSTLHSWRNEGTTPVSMFIVTVSAT